jgi:hypothetical protein
MQTVAGQATTTTAAEYTSEALLYHTVKSSPILPLKPAAESTSQGITIVAIPAAAKYTIALSVTTQHHPPAALTAQ